MTNTRKMNIEQCREALNQAEEALSTWVNSYAPEFCDPAHVEAAANRLKKHGTLAYIADKLSIVRQACAALEQVGKPIAPEGWKLVPVESNAEMAFAGAAEMRGLDPDGRNTFDGGDIGRVADVYKAMVERAPARG